MVTDTLANLGIVATGAATAGLIARYGIQRFSRVIETGIDQSAAAAETGIERSATVLEDGIEQFFDEKIARHQSEIAARRIESSRIHEDRASVIRKLYQRFVQCERDLRALKTARPGEQSGEDLLQRARTSSDAFKTFYREHKIYFPSETCETIEHVQAAMSDVLDGFETGRAHRDPPGTKATDESGFVAWREVTGAEVPELTDELENQFRTLLGVDLDEVHSADSERFR